MGRRRRRGRTKEGARRDGRRGQSRSPAQGQAGRQHRHFLPAAPRLRKNRPNPGRSGCPRGRHSLPGTHRTDGRSRRRCTPDHLSPGRSPQPAAAARCPPPVHAASPPRELHEPRPDSAPQFEVITQSIRAPAPSSLYRPRARSWNPFPWGRRHSRPAARASIYREGPRAPSKTTRQVGSRTERLSDPREPVGRKPGQGKSQKRGLTSAGPPGGHLEPLTRPLSRIRPAPPASKPALREPKKPRRTKSQGVLASNNGNEGQSGPTSRPETEKTAFEGRKTGRKGRLIRSGNRSFEVRISQIERKPAAESDLLHLVAHSQAPELPRKQAKRSQNQGLSLTANSPQSQSGCGSSGIRGEQQRSIEAKKSRPPSQLTPGSGMAIISFFAADTAALQTGPKRSESESPGPAAEAL